MMDEFLRELNRQIMGKVMNASVVDIGILREGLVDITEVVDRIMDEVEFEKSEEGAS